MKKNALGGKMQKVRIGVLGTDATDSLPSKRRRITPRAISRGVGPQQLPRESVQEAKGRRVLEMLDTLAQGVVAAMKKRVLPLPRSERGPLDRERPLLTVLLSYLILFWVGVLTVHGFS